MRHPRDYVQPPEKAAMIAAALSGKKGVEIAKEFNRGLVCVYRHIPKKHKPKKVMGETFDIEIYKQEII